MKMKKEIIGIIIIFIVAGAGIFAPGQLMEYQSGEELAKVNKVPSGNYAISQEALTKMASANLSTSEQLQLIRGEWESTIKEADERNMTLDSYQAVQLAKDGIAQLYKKGAGTGDLGNIYGNWFYWETECMEAVDTTFGTYAAKYWIIHFYRYDGEQSLTVQMLEDGTIFEHDGIPQEEE